MIRFLGLAVIGAMLVVALALAGDSAAQTVIENPSFETGDTMGWVETIPPGGAIEVVNQCDADCTGSGASTPYNPVDGDWFAVLKTDGPESFTMLSQTLTAQAGVVIGGSAFFIDTEFFFGPCDEAQVNVYVEGVLAEAVFEASTCTTSSTDWTDWEFTVPGVSCEEVEITVEARVANQGDGVVDARIGLDALEVDESACPTPTAVPSEDDDEDGSERVPVPTAPPHLGGLLGPLLAATDANRERNRDSSDAPTRQQDVAGVQAGVIAAVGPISPPNTGSGGLLKP